MDNHIFFVVIDNLGFVVLFLGLVIGWRNPFARWLVISYSILTCISFACYQVTISWKTHFYIFEAFICLVFMLPILLRRYIAFFIYQKTRRGFFLTVAMRKKLTVYESFLLRLFTLAAIVNFITWIEILCYKYWLIDTPYIKLYFRDYFVALVLLLQNIALYAFIMYCYASMPAPDIKRRVHKL
ncbi:hypothetical protein N483_02555 [Pseudoalteromonas luteoviolacea NCIMB 1944]|uniref:Intracellular septation protein A n=1 Tax=Pseudoalteromonas luteoviolacea (strain 2ta16) TaxID=1353533 RepID=V4HW44_PSEL2|nr:hypothetical protein PL2TA16_02522 [Pseudoalteromonas luteoviolacea 2ta16]KZN33512.1 hypothetical protein N483_02555 [Pseudoalteromonas luteoviolacea NCIMB 1944]